MRGGEWGAGRGLRVCNTNLQNTPKRRKKPARRKLVRGRGRAVGEVAGRGRRWRGKAVGEVAGQGSGGEWGRKWQRMSGTPPRVTPSPAPQNSSPTSKQGQAFAANSLWPCTVARGKRRRSRSTSASSAMRCEGVRVSFGEPSLASRPPM